MILISYLIELFIGINAFLDKKCLKDGEDWKQGFLRGDNLTYHCFNSIRAYTVVECLPYKID